ncbi:uncharacterized protein LOC121804062 [Salvia splendens]|uniref:uncharacterized protein LOC121804062 n=1 Tax=Salvia splendens TaxID=180675 RepID=UPI001C2600D7|nr:uncharacterized protein LOC121804062 [Salvia splendens]
MVTYIPLHLRGNQQYNQPRYQQEYYGQSDHLQPNYSGGPPNQRYNRHPNESHIEMLIPHHPNDAVREKQEAQKEQRAALEMLTKQLYQVAVSLGELKGNEATMQPPGHENISEEEGESSRGGQVEEKGKERVGGEASEETQKEETERVKPYPYRGMVTRKRDATIDVASMFKDMDVKVPLLTALKMPPISKFIKDYLAGKVNEKGRLITDENVSAVEHAMCDLGASINVLPYSIYRKLEEAKLVDTDIMIQLADRSCIHPEGILEDVIVKSSGVLLGRPFLSTASTIIGVCNGMISLDFKGEQYTFNINEAMKRPADGENVYSVDVTEPLVQEF